MVQSRDTNVLALLLCHYHRMTCTQFWLKTCTAKKRQYIPIHDIVDHMPYNAVTRESIPAFHALTGSDTTSYIGRLQQEVCLEDFSDTSSASGKPRKGGTDC